MSEINVIDAEMMAALKVLRGDNNKNNSNNVDSVDKAHSNTLTQTIVDVLTSQHKTSEFQNSEILKAIKQQNIILENLTSLLSKKQKTTVVVVNKEAPASNSSVASTAAETNMSAITEDADVVAAVAAAEQATNAPIVIAAAPKAVVPVPPPPPKPRVIQGPWGFVESEVAIMRRSRIEKSSGSFRLLPKDTKAEDIPADAFTPLTNEHILNKEDALFGQVSASSVSDDDEQAELKGDSFGQYWDRMRSQVDQYGKLKAPKWSTLGKSSVRSYLPRLSIGGKTQIKLKSGIYYLTMTYENPSAKNNNVNVDDSKEIEAAIIIGEIAFDCRGHVLAPGADWAKIFAGETQLQPSPAGKAGGKLKWHSSKISEPWKNGDTLKFKIDTHENTVGFTLKGPDDKEVRTGWMFTNVLSFTNNRTYPDYLQVLAYCGGTSSSLISSSNNKSSFDSVKFNIIDTRRTPSSASSLLSTSGSISSISEREIVEDEEVATTTALIEE